MSKDRAKLQGSHTLTKWPLKRKTEKNVIRIYNEANAFSQQIEKNKVPI